MTKDIRPRGVCERFYPHLSPATLHRYRRRGIIPAPDGIIGQSPFWFESTINRAIEKLADPQAVAQLTERGAAFAAKRVAKSQLGRAAVEESKDVPA